MSRTTRTEAADPTGRRNLVTVDASSLEDQILPERLAFWQSELPKLGVRAEEIRRSLPCVEAIHQIRDTDLNQSFELAQELRANCDAIIVLATRSAYLCGRALTDLQRANPFSPKPHLVMEGYHLEESWMESLLGFLQESNLRVGVAALSHGSPSAELVWAFRRLQSQVSARHGEAESRRRIVLVADTKGGELGDEGYRRLALPDKLPSALLMFSQAAHFPMHLAGLDAQQFVEGARSQVRGLDKGLHPDDPIARYALCRQVLVQDEGLGEVFVYADPSMESLARWCQMLSEPTSQHAGVPFPYPNHAPLLGSYHSPLHESHHYEIHVGWNRPRGAGENADPRPLQECERAVALARPSVGQIRLCSARFDIFSQGALSAFLGAATSVNHRLTNVPWATDNQQVTYLPDTATS